jgi:putative transposase
VIASLTGQGNNVRHACRFLGVTESGYYAWRSRPTSPRALRRIFLAGEIVDVHRSSVGIYGALRITAELRFGRQIVVGHNAVASIMNELGIKGVPKRRMPHWHLPSLPGAGVHAVLVGLRNGCSAALVGQAHVELGG